MNYMQKQKGCINKRVIGKTYEALATSYLIDKGYTIMCNNYRCKCGEIDIIAKYEDTLVFVEVKYRKDNFFGNPCQAVNYKKQQRILITAKFYLRAYYKYELECRFDIIEILGDTITHIEAAF